METRSRSRLILSFVFIAASLCGRIQSQKHDAISNDTAESAAGIINWYRSTNFGSIFSERADDESEENCTARSIHTFPDDLFTKQQRQDGAVVLHVFFGFYCFIMTALVCDMYFLPSVDCICTDLKISTDVAAATFMASATCAPELFTNIIGTFLTESDLGIGAVVGSGVFNTFGVATCGGLAAANGIQMKKWALTRDCIIYSLAVGVVTLMMWDQAIDLNEAIILMVLYVLYFIFLFCNKIFVRWGNKCLSRSYRQKDTEQPIGQSKETLVENGTVEEGVYTPIFHGELVIEYRNSMRKSSQKKAATLSQISKNLEKSNESLKMEEYVEPDTPFTLPTGSKLMKIWWAFLWPLRVILFVTIPDCRFKRMRNFYPLTFIMCIIWIGICSYTSSWMLTVFGDTIGISDAVMGLTFLAAGGSMPEAISSTIMAREGHGEMGLSNSLGANTLDILLCLGLPWLIKILISGESIAVVSATITYSCLSLFLTVVAMYAAIAAFGFRLNKTVGFACLFMYAIFLVLAICLESNVFFFANLPMCPE